MNTDVYTLVGLILQIAQAHNVPVGGGKYNVPSGDFTDHGTPPPQNLTSYSTAAIAGADNFSDDGLTIKGLFDTLVDITRTITPTCKFLWCPLAISALLMRS